MALQEAIAAVAREFETGDFDKLQKAMRILIQELQKQQGSERLLQSQILKIFTQLLELIFSQDCPVEISLLSGTTIFLIFYNLVPLAEAVDCMWSLLSPQDASILPETNGHRTEAQQILESTLGAISTSGDQSLLLKLVIIHGILSARKQDFLLRNPSRSGKCLFYLMASPIIGMCRKASSYPFQVFQALASWMKMAESVGMAVPDGQREFLLGSELVSDLVVLLEANWESSIRGVSEFVKEIYAKLLRLNNNVTKKSEDLETLAAARWRTVAKMSWKQKGKYIGLSLLVPYANSRQLDSLDLPPHLITNLAVNHLFSSIASLYRCLITSLRKCCATEEAFLEAWKSKWGSPLLKALNSQQQLVKINIIRHLLPWTLKQLPGAIHILLGGDTTEENLAPKLIVARLGRQNGLISLPDLFASGRLPLQAYHADPDVRLETLALVCSFAKRSEPPGETEFCLALKLVLSNMAVDSAPFRYDLTRHLRTLLERLRDSCLKQRPVPEQAIEFVESLIEICGSNLFPGAAYQRRLMALSIYRDLCAIFTGPSAQAYQKAIETIQQSGRWHFLSEANFYKILVCIMDSVDEVRHQTAEILGTFFPPPADCTDLATLFQQLCDSPQSQECDGGAYLAALLFSRVLPHCPVPMPRRKACTSQLEFLQYLLAETKSQHCLAQDDLLQAAGKKPIHGRLLAISRCCCDDPQVFRELCGSQPSNMTAWVDDLVSQCQLIAADMLALTGVGPDDDCAPSFEEMNLSISNKLEQLTGAKCSDDQFQLAMAFCWLSIKECALLLGKLTATALDTPVLSPNTLHRIADTLTSILFKCRHKGAIEASRLSFEKFCQALLNSPHQNHRDIPETILRKLFSQLIGKTSATSITRRSAGLSLLVHSLVVAEPGWKPRRLVKFAMEQLLDLASTSEGQESGKVDIPRTQGFHIARELVNDSSLSRDILPWMSQVVPVCFDGFTSPSWAVRNGALQLYGAVILRLVGQKKVRDEDSAYNGCTPLELFSKYPGLRDFLVQLLTASVSRQDCAPDPGLVPCLSFLARLVPDPSRQEEIAPFTPLLIHLMHSPIWTVRVLAATVLASFESQDVLLPALLHNLESSPDWNLVHASLLGLEKLLPGCPPQKQETALSSILDLAQRSAPCAVVQAHCLKVLNDHNYLCGDPVTPELEGKPGHPLLRKETFRWQLRTSPPSQIRNLICRGLSHFNTCQDIWELTLLCIQNSAPILSEQDLVLILDQLASILDQAQGSTLHQVVEILVQLCSLTAPPNGELYDKVVRLVTASDNTEVPILVRPSAFLLWSQLRRYKSAKQDERWGEILLHMSQPDQPADTRTIAAQALTPGLDGTLEPQHLLRIFEACLLLLQDENELIRTEAALFVSRLQSPTCFCGHSGSLQSHVAIQVWMSWAHHQLSPHPAYLSHLASHLYLDSLQPKLAALFVKGEYKLFEQEEINLHAEPITISHLFAYLLKDTITEANQTFWKQHLISTLPQTLEDIHFARKFLTDLHNQNPVSCLVRTAKQSAALVNFGLHCQLLQAAATALQMEEGPGQIIQEFQQYLAETWCLDHGALCWQMDRWDSRSSNVTKLAVAY